MLATENLHCKETFREIKQKVRDTVIVHHFLNRRKPLGRSKCSKCDKGFGSWKFMSGREIISVTCSWCGDSYHPTCFSPRLNSEPCHMGPLRRLIIPSSWIVRVPFVEKSHGDESPKPFSVTRRKTRRSRRKKLESRPSKYFKVKAFSKQQKPLLVFINPRSGGNQGARLLQTFQWLLNPRQVFDLSKGGPTFGLQMFQDLSDVRILACGGDGTVGWVLSVIDELCIKPFPPVAVLPLGTGNDLSRVLGWGSGYSDEPLDKILMHVDEGPVVEMDRWQISVWHNDRVPRVPADAKDSVDDVPIHVINNYFSIGADAHVTLEFHLGREANPEKYNTRMKNKFYYTKLGGKDLLQRKFADLADYIKIIGDGIDLTPRIQAQRLEAICFLNIPSYGAGTNPWGTPSSHTKLGPQVIDDGRIEVVGFWASTFPKLQMGMSHGERIAQCEHIKMYTMKSLPVQIDGEPCKLQPSIVEVVQKNTAQMIRKVPRKYSETPLKGVAPSEQIKMSVSKVTKEQYHRLYSDVQELRRAATPLGLIMTSVEDTLDMVRKQVDQFTSPDDDEDGARPLSVNWKFLETSSGLAESMFQVMPDQEHSMTIGNMPSDGIIVVETDSVPSQTHAPKMFSPEEDILEHPLTSLSDLTLLPDPISDGRPLGRSQSYKRATSPSSDLCPLPPPRLLSQADIVNETADLQLQVPETKSKKRGSVGSNASEDGYEGDTENLSPSPLRHIDMGSDSAGGDTDGASVPSSLQKALIDAVKRGQVDKVQQYHEAGAKLTVTDANGWTALHHAARLGKYVVVEYLVARLPKEALDLVDEEKLQTPLHKAAWYGYVNICKLLVENGASLFRHDYQGNTALSQAKQHGDKELQKYLKSKEAEQKSKEQEGELAI
jgi:diacylglycerol kinase (ATP)